MLNISLPYTPPYDWDVMHGFLSVRMVDHLEWVEENAYGRTFRHGNAKGIFTVRHNVKQNCFDAEIELDDTNALESVIQNIRRIFDLDRDGQQIDSVLKKALGQGFPFQSGTRLPGLWSVFEAGIRAILGQQISVKAAHRYCAQLVDKLGDRLGDRKLFPTAVAMAESDLGFLKMPQSKRATLQRFAVYMASGNEDHNPESWIDLKGIGKWTVQYAQMRGESQPDIYMGGDLGVIKMQGVLPKNFKSEAAAPWRSYLTLQLWRQL